MEEKIGSCATFIPGEIVALKSGGLAMTVLNSVLKSENELVICVWMLRDGTIAKESFNVMLLQRVTKPKEENHG